jgi:hypothetical protein
MGQGFSLTTLSAGSANIDVPELADLQYEKSLGAARFMKAVRARHKDGLVVARVVMKPYAQFNFHVYVSRLLGSPPQAPAYLGLLTRYRRTQAARRSPQCFSLPSYN